MRTVRSGDVDLAVYESGPAGAPTVVMVHGYPDNASVWAPVADLLAADYHVVRYDVRGAGSSTAPGNRTGYQLARLCDDFEAVIDATSPDKPVHVVAHDWGSIQSWEAVTELRLQSRIASYTSISGPCLDHIAFWMRDRARRPTPAKLSELVRQLVHSTYVGVFHLPLAGVMMGAGSRVAPRFMKMVEGVDAAPTASDLRRGVQLYRANMVPRARAPRERRTNIPVQVVVLKGDRYVTPALTLGIERWAPNLWRREVVGGHWTIAAHPARTAAWVSELIEHVSGQPASRRLSRSRVDVRRRRFTDEVVVITGTGSGFGRATALAFAKRGATVVGADINGDAAEETAGLCRSAGATAVARTVDVSSVEDMEIWAKEVLAEYGAPDVVVNNAGIAIAGPAVEMTADDWDRILGVNLQGVIHGCRLFGKAMVDRGEGGHIVNIASAAGFGPVPTLTAYATTKAAVLQLSRSLRGELAPQGIGVSAICPGFSATGIGASMQVVGSRVLNPRRADRALRLATSPTVVADAIVDAVLYNREVVATGIDARLIRALNRLSPGAVSALGRALGRTATFP